MRSKATHSKIPKLKLTSAVFAKRREMKRPKNRKDLKDLPEVSGFVKRKRGWFNG